MAVTTGSEHTIHVPTELGEIRGDLVVPAQSLGVIIFAHGSGSSRFSPRNRFVAEVLNDGGFATLLMDLLTASEESVDEFTRHHCFDIALLARRLVSAMEWARSYNLTSVLPIGLFGASTGAAAAIIASARRPKVEAIVSRGGRPDLAGDTLGDVTAPTLLIVGGDDTVVIELNREAQSRMRKAETQLEIIPGASHLFEEGDTLARAASAAREWFARYLRRERIDVDR